MNIGEMKQEFQSDVRTNNFEILKAEKLHLNVSKITARIGDKIVQAGFSWDTIIGISIEGYCFITNYIYSSTTQKHKGQIMLDGSNKNLPHELFTFLKHKILSDTEPTIEEIQKLCANERIKIVRTNDIDKTVYGYLSNHEFIESFSFIEKVKDLIRMKAWNQNKILINIGHNIISITVKRTQDPNNRWKTNKSYTYNESDKEYKNLSFLNKLKLDKVVEVI
jgi:hypothetical protein